MFGCPDLQSEVHLTIIFLLLLVSNPSPSNASKMNQSPKLPQHVPQNEAAAKQMSSKNKIDIHRLYYAYRDRVKKGVDDPKLGTGPIAESTAIADEDDGDSLAKSETDVRKGIVDRLGKTSLMVSVENSKGVKKTQLMSSTVNCDAPDDRNVGDVKCVPQLKTKDVEDKHKNRENSDTKEPEVKGVVILKMDLLSKDKVDPSITLGKSKGYYSARDYTELRISELNRFYKEFISAWKKPQSDSKTPNLFVSKPVRLNALNELMNVVENLKQPNTMDDFVKAINDKITRESEGLTSRDKLYDNTAKSNQMKIERAIGIFKRMSNNVNVGDFSDLKTGGLYEQYKSKLNEILKAHKSPNNFNGNDISQCHCDAKKPLTLALDSKGNRISYGPNRCHCDASRYALEGDSSKLSNAVVQCHCDDMKSASLVDPKTEKCDDYSEACMKINKEKSTNGGPKPYYISNSKQRQMVWNDIPLMRSAQNKATKTVVKSLGKISADSQENSQATVEASSLDAKPQSEQPIIKSLQRNVKSSLTFNKNQKQLQHLLKVLQVKHRSSSAKRSYKRGFGDFTDRNGNQLGNVGFPQVLVHPVGTGQQSGSRMIDNMAKQLNVSPMEMAQRIAASSNSLAPSSYPLQSSSARPSETKSQMHKQITRLRRKIHSINWERQT